MVGKMHIISNIIAINKDFCPTHNNLTKYNVLQFCLYIQDKNSYRNGNPPIGVDHMLVHHVGMGLNIENCKLMGLQE